MSMENKPVFPINIQVFADESEELSDVIDNAEVEETTDTEDFDDTEEFEETEEVDEELDNDGDEDTEDSEEQEEDKADGTENDNTNTENQNTTDDEYEEIIYNGQPVKIPKSEIKTYLQKGYNYDKVKTQAERAKADLMRSAKFAGFDNVQDYLAAIEQAEREEEQRKLVEAASDPNKLQELIDSKIMNHPMLLEAQRIKFERDLQLQKEALKGEDFFEELEPEIDQLVRSVRGMDAATAYHFLLGKNFKKLIAQKAEATKKSTIADIADKAKRSVGNIKSDSSGNGEVEITSEVKEIARSFGISPKALAKRLAEKRKNK